MIGWPKLTNATGAAPATSPELQAYIAGEVSETSRASAAKLTNARMIAECVHAAGLVGRLWPPRVAELVRDHLRWWADMGHPYAPAPRELVGEVMAEARKAGRA